MSRHLRTAARRACLLGVAVLGACGFEVNSGPTDAMKPIDTPDAKNFIASCADVHAAMPSAPSGMYEIDPDGPGGDAAFMASCDMVTDGGGWTIVFVAPNPNLTATPLAYTQSSPRLLADATRAMIAFRSAALVASPGFATFDMPAQWRTDTPFNYEGVDEWTKVTVDGKPEISATLRFGKNTFGTGCSDPWSSAQTFGRVCVVATTAPFFAGFTGADPDGCSDSGSPWSARACAADVRFSIAVR